jgi:tetratricopeptide (TPR) repeat protein
MWTAVGKLDKQVKRSMRETAKGAWAGLPGGVDVGQALESFYGPPLASFCFESALMHMQKALEIQQNMSPPPYANIVLTLEHLAGVYSDLVDFEKAAEVLKQALDKMEELPEVEVQRKVVLMSKRTWLLGALGHYTEGLQLLEHALALAQSPDSGADALIVSMLLRQADLHCELMQDEEAMKVCEEALQRLEGQEGETVRRAIIKRMMGRLHHLQGHEENAGSYYQAAIDALKEGPHDPKALKSYEGELLSVSTFKDSVA